MNDVIHLFPVKSNPRLDADVTLVLSTIAKLDGAKWSTPPRRPAAHDEKTFIARHPDGEVVHVYCRQEREFTLLREIHVAARGRSISFQAPITGQLGFKGRSPMNYAKPSGPVILVPTTAEGSRQLPHLREVFAALASIDASTPFTCSRKNKEGNQRIRWKDAGITITGIVLPGCIHLTILEIEHRSDAGALKITPWRFHHSTLNREHPADGVAEFLKEHVPLSDEAAALLSEASPSTTLANIVSSALSCHEDSEFEKRAAAHRNNGAPAYFKLDTDPIFCRISGNPHDIEDNLVPKTILDLPLFARCSYTPGDDITVPVYDFSKDLRIEWQATDPIANLANLSTLDKLHALLKADRA